MKKSHQLINRIINIPKLQLQFVLISSLSLVAAFCYTQLNDESEQQNAIVQEKASAITLVNFWRITTVNTGVFLNTSMSPASSCHLLYLDESIWNRTASCQRGTQQLKWPKTGVRFGHQTNMLNLDQDLLGFTFPVFYDVN